MSFGRCPSGRSLRTIPCLIASLVAASLSAASFAQSSPEPRRAENPAEEKSLLTPLNGSSVEKPAAAVAKPTSSTADEAFTTRVKTLEEQVTDLKEKIFRTKARLLLLQETVLGGDLSVGARAVLLHRNEMGSSFIIESVAYALDGAPIFTKVDVNGDLQNRRQFEIFNGRIVAGQHQIAAKIVYRGHGYGLFSYLEGYKFKVQSSYTFNAEAGKVTTVKIVGFEKGGFTSDFKDRPAIRYDIEVAKDAGMRPGSAPKAQLDRK